MRFHLHSCMDFSGVTDLSNMFTKQASVQLADRNGDNGVINTFCQRIFSEKLQSP